MFRVNYMIFLHRYDTCENFGSEINVGNPAIIPYS